MAKRKRLGPAIMAAPQEGAAPPAPPISQVVGDASASAALQEMSDALSAAQREGRMIREIPLAQIDESYLARDRISADPEEMDALKRSIAARGQQTPIDLVELGPERFGLISGWRRCRALRELGESKVRALVTPPRAASDAYVAMVEENEIRVGLSYFERAQLVLRSVELGVFDTVQTALQSLFSTASRAKRSKIKSFITVVETLGDDLQFPSHLGERLGLQLAKAVGDEDSAARLKTALRTSDAETFEVEQAALTQALNAASEPKSKPAKPSRAPEDITLLRSPSGGLVTLKGAGVTEAFCNDLEMWLKARSSLV